MGSRERVTEYLRTIGIESEVVEFDTSTRSSILAAKALGCSLAEIAKSVVFVGEGATVVVISGDRRVGAAKLQGLVGQPQTVANPKQVRDLTGYPIGGVPPFPHDSGVRVLVDASLRRHRWVWAAAGTPNSVFRVGVEDLIGRVGGMVCDVSEQAPHI